MTEVGNGRFKEITLEIDELGVGDLLCEQSFMLKKPLDITCVSSLPCEILVIESLDFKTRLSDKAIHQIIDNIKLYPSDNDLRKVYVQNRLWENYKTNFRGDLVLHHNLKNFSQDLKGLGHLSIPKTQFLKSPVDILQH